MNAKPKKITPCIRLACLLLVMAVSTAAFGQIKIKVTVTNVTSEVYGGYGSLASNGVINAVASGGSAPYTYELTDPLPWSPQVNGYFPALTAGSYIVSVTDSAGQTADSTVVVGYNFPQPLLLVSTLVEPSGSAAEDGVIGLQASGGTPPYLYSIDGGNTFTNNNIFTGLAQGLYFVIVRDGNGQIAMKSPDSLSPNLPSLVFLICSNCFNLNSYVTPHACYKDGALHVQTTISEPADISFSLDSVHYLPLNENLAFPDLYYYDSSYLDPGLYHIYLRDNIGDTVIGAAVITKFCTIDITFVDVSASCHQSDGSLTVTAVNGLPPYTYTMDGINYQTSNVFTGLASGWYSVTVRDANGLTSSANGYVFNKCPVITATQTDETCGQNNGIITASGTSGTKPYQFSINGINFQPDSIFTGLSSGNYTVTLKDANGFTDSTAVAINNNCLKVTATVTPEHCNQVNGSIAATSSGGTPPYQYSISSPFFFKDSVFTGLDSGTYTVTVKDANALTSTDTVKISNIPAPVVKLGNDTTLCAGQTLTLAVNIAGSNITYAWQDGSAGASYTVSAAGTYWVHVTAIGCHAADTIQVAYLTLSNNIFPTHDTTLCKGASLPLNAGNAGAAYLWNDGSNTQTKAVDSSGKYWVRVTTNGCSASDTITCQFVTGPAITLPKDTAFCAGQQLVLKAGTGNATYIWDNNTGGDSLDVTQGGSYWVAGTANGCTNYDTVQVVENPAPAVFIGNDTTVCAGMELLLKAPEVTQYQYLWQNNSATDSLVVTQAGSYWLKVTNQYNCFTADTIHVRYHALPVFSLGNDTSLCNGQTLKLQVSVPQAKYLWSTGSTASALEITASGTYWLNVSDSGCVKSDTVSVSFKPLPVIALGNDTTLCTGETLLLNVANNNATYLWQDGSTQPSYTVTSQGSYSVTVSLNGCDTTGEITVDYITKPAVSIGSDTTLCTGYQLVLNAAYPQTSYLWQDGSTQPVYTITIAGVYSVKASNACGTVTDSVSVQYENCDCKFYMPSAFTPNGDGRNDVFKPTYKCFFSQYQLKVFNRFGQNIYSSQNADTGWDGTVNGFQQPPGTYLWMIEYFDSLAGKMIKRNGTLVLIR